MHEFWQRHGEHIIIILAFTGHQVLVAIYPEVAEHVYYVLDILITLL